MASHQQPGPQQTPSVQQQDSDPVHRFKTLVPRLRESLQHLLSAAAASLACNAPTDGAWRFDRSLEDFYALCDQLETCVRLADESRCQSGDSATHSPSLVPTATKPDVAQSETTSYGLYLGSVRAQVSCVEEMRKALLECCKKVTGEGQLEGNM